MITTLILSISIPVVAVISYFIGKRITKRKIKRILGEGTGRMGIVKYRSDYMDTYAFIEVEELEVAGTRTKVRIHDVVPYRNSKVKSRNEVLNNWGQSDWILTNDIVWYENNTQKVRDKKLEKILQ